MNAALQRCANAPGQCAPLQLRAGCPAALPAHAGPCFLGRVLVQGPVCLRGVQRVAAAETSTSSLLSGVPLDRGVTVSSEPAAAGAGLDGVPLESEAGQDYSKLKSLLAAQDSQAADDETRDLLIRLAGPEAVKRKWVYFTEVKFIPAADLQTLDRLWRAASGNKFGYSVQKELWVQNRRYWEKFFKAIDWVQGEHNIYRKWPAGFTYSLAAARGHLPLTNALRGTQLFKAIMEHPAFERPQSETRPDWLK